jgi:hypothetical protein
MMDALKALFKQPYWIIALVAGTLLLALPCVTIDKDYHWATHAPTTYIPVVFGALLLVVSVLAFGFTLWTTHTSESAGTGLDLTRVKEHNGEMWTVVNGSEIRVVTGRLEDCVPDDETLMVLPSNEYFDDACANDQNSALGAYVHRKFEGQVKAFELLVQEERKKQLVPENIYQKTAIIRAESFGAGRCLLLVKPLGRTGSIALVSTTTQRDGQGLSSKISYMFDGMRVLVEKMADARLNKAAMPVFGAGHGRVDPALALVGLLLAVAEVARYGQGGQRLRGVTIVVFKRDANSPPEVDPMVVRRALALIGSRDL